MEPRSCAPGAGLGPSLRLDRGRMVEEAVTDVGYVFQVGLSHGEERWIERHVLGVVEVEVAGRWAWFDAGPAAFTVGPRLGIGVDGHWGACGKRILGVGVDVRSLHATGGDALHTAMISGVIRAGWDLPRMSDYCEDLLTALTAPR